MPIQANAVTLSDAQRAYVAGNWKEAASAYEETCPSEPVEKQPECYLWNVLALSQTGAAKDFSKAGKRLDSLITTTNPQNKIYADLMMTKAQFQIYLGKYEKSAESLIHAIETSQPHQVTVLQKVCVAVQAKTKNERLDEACKSLNEPRATLVAAAPAQETSAAPVQNATVAAAPAATPQPTQEVKAEPAPAATSSATETPNAVAASSAAVSNVVATSSASTTSPTTSAPAETKAAASATAQPTAQAAPTAPAPVAAQPATPVAAAPATKEYWTLQLGAFGVKSNADILVSNLKKRGITAKIEERPGETKTLYLVQSGEFATKDAAIDFGAQKLTPMNLEFRAILRK